MNFQKLTDCQLYDYCRSSGLEARKWKNRFVAALPEVYKRRLYKKKGFCSIYEFAAKMAGVSQNVVDESLRLDEKFDEMPQIKSLIPETGISKLRVIANVAQKETDKFWAEKVKTMSRGALEVYVREIKKIPGEFCGKNANPTLLDAKNNRSEIQNLKNQNDDTSMREKFTMQLDAETVFKLKLVKNKLEKEKGEPLCWNEVINLAAEKILKPVKRRKKPSSLKTVKITRYIPAAKKRELQEKFKGRCAYPGCNKPAVHLHHIKRFALKKSHDEVVPLCLNHHEIAHHGLIKNEEGVTADWAVKKIANKLSGKFAIDKMVIRRKMALST